jgi:hypothetical protein
MDCFVALLLAMTRKTYHSPEVEDLARAGVNELWG